MTRPAIVKYASVQLYLSTYYQATKDMMKEGNIAGISNNSQDFESVTALTREKMPRHLQLSRR
jgi:hypothetical protein